MDANISPFKLTLLKRIMTKACIAWGEPAETLDDYINDILARAESYDHAIACFERLIEDATKKAKFAKEWTRSPGKLYLPIAGHENCYHTRKSNESKKDRR